MDIPGFIQSRIDLPVAVLGAGVSGAGAVALIEKLGATAVMYDRKGTGFTSRDAGRHRLIVFSPGFHREHPWLEAARSAGCLCLAELDFASLFWNGRVVAVTGTNGKTTLTEFLVHALSEAGIAARVAGNIGIPFTRLAAEEGFSSSSMTAVCEVSSFQAEQLAHFSADALLWTNFAEDHLERHGSMESYFLAKWELVLRCASGRFFAGSSVGRYASLFGRPIPDGALVASEALAPDPRLEGTLFGTYPQRENFVLASAWWESVGLGARTLVEAAHSFQVGRHRLSRVAQIDGVTFWNDSKATNFHAVEAALGSFSSPVVLIGGGRSKGGDLAAFVQRIASRVGCAVLIGETGPALSAAFDAAGVPCRLCPTIEDAVRTAALVAVAGGNVLLSPGFSSFDMFEDYKDRGDRFEEAVASLREAPVC